MIKKVFSFIIAFPSLAQTSFGGTPPSWNISKTKLKSNRELKSYEISNQIGNL